MKVTVASPAPEVHQIIRQLLSPWRVAFTGLDEADVLIVYGGKPPENMETIVIPSDSVDFTKWLKDEGLSVIRKPGRQTFIAATPQTTLSMVPQMQYHYDESVESISSISQPPPIELNDDTILLTADIIEEYGRIMVEALEPRVSTLYRLLTGLPIPYTVVPKRLRNLVMGRKAQQTSLDLYDKLPLDALRFLLARAIEKTTDKGLERKTWNGKSYACAITHDIDTHTGLIKAKVIKRLEEKYDVPSAWYIPTKHYKLDPETIRELANYGEIGAHDVRHDGKLAQLPKQKIVERLREAKQTLEKIVGRPVEGFRTPLLQCNAKTIQALEEVGYLYDASVPTWEPNHPYTMKPYGIGTVNPMDINSVVEIPLTLPQDHQMLHVLGMTPKQAVGAWIKLKDGIRDIGGICTILVHPDYELADPRNLDAFEELLNAMVVCDAWVTTPKELITGVA